MRHTILTLALCILTACGGDTVTGPDTTAVTVAPTPAPTPTPTPTPSPSPSPTPDAPPAPQPTPAPADPCHSIDLVGGFTSCPTPTTLRASADFSKAPGWVRFSHSGKQVTASPTYWQNPLTWSADITVTSCKPGTVVGVVWGAEPGKSCGSGVVPR